MTVFVEDGMVTEGPRTNAYIVKGNRIITGALSSDHPAWHHPRRVLRFAEEAQFEVEERSFTIEEAKAADEAFFDGASIFVMPSGRDRRGEGGGRQARQGRHALREIYIDEMRKAAI